MIILGLDIATTTGFCLMEKGTRPSAWECGFIKSAGANGEEKAGHLAVQLVRFIKQNGKPDFVAIEMPQRSVTSFKKERQDFAGQFQDQTINPNALQLSALAGAAVAILDAYRIPWGLIAPATWRGAYFGKGNKPKDGNWKQFAVDMAHTQQVSLPSSKMAQRDAAEAIGIAVAWEKCTFIPERHQGAFMALRMGRTAPREVAAV